MTYQEYWKLREPDAGVTRWQLAHGVKPDGLFGAASASAYDRCILNRCEACAELRREKGEPMIARAARPRYAGSPFDPFGERSAELAAALRRVRGADETCNASLAHCICGRSFRPSDASETLCGECRRWCKQCGGTVPLCPRCEKGLDDELRRHEEERCKLYEEKCALSRALDAPHRYSERAEREAREAARRILEEQRVRDLCQTPEGIRARNREIVELAVAGPPSGAREFGQRRGERWGRYSRALAARLELASSCARPRLLDKYDLGLCVAIREGRGRGAHGIEGLRAARAQARAQRRGLTSGGAYARPGLRVIA